jgi:hypothetical protein
MNQVKVNKSKCRPREGTGIRARIKRRNRKQKTYEPIEERRLGIPREGKGTGE